MESKVGLQFLPVEVIADIASYLTLEDVLACSTTCFLLRQALNDDLVWKKQCSFKSLDYFKWGNCENKPEFLRETNESDNGLPLAEVCTWRKYFMMEVHRWKNWISGKYNTLQFEFKAKNDIPSYTKVVFYNNDYLFVYTWEMSEPKLMCTTWSVQNDPFVSSETFLDLNQFLTVQDYLCVYKMSIVDNNKLVVLLGRLVFVFDLNISAFSSEILLKNSFFVDGSDEGSPVSKKFTPSQILVIGTLLIALDGTQDNVNKQVVLHFWNIESGEKVKEKKPVSNNKIDNCSLLLSENKEDFVVKLRVAKHRYMYHYYGYNVSKLEFSQFLVKVNYCDFERFYDDSVIGIGPQNLAVYSYKTSQKTASKNFKQEILKRTVKIVGGYLLCGTFENVIYVLNPSDLVLVNTVVLGTTIFSLNVVVDKFVVLNKNSCEVWQIGKTSKKLFKLPTDSSFIAVNEYGTKLAAVQGNKIKVLSFW